MAILKDTLIQGACRVIGDAYMSLVMASGFKKDGSSDSYVLLGGGGHKAVSDFVQITSSNRLGVYRLYRRDDNSNYSVQTDWTGTYWRLRGYSADTYHAGCLVAYADSAGSVAWSDVLTKPDTATRWPSYSEVTSKPIRLNEYITSNDLSSSTYNGFGRISSGNPLSGFTGSDVDCMTVNTAYSSAWAGQLALDYRTSNIAYRAKNNGTWQDWAIMLSDKNYSSYILPLSGGQMTGALTVPSISVTGAATFSLAINGSILGNAATASRLLNARTITIGSLSNTFDGSSNISYTLASIGAFASSSFTQANIKSTLGISNWALASSKPSYYIDEILYRSSNYSDPRLFGFYCNGSFKYDSSSKTITFSSAVSSDAVNGGTYWQISSGLRFKHPVRLSFRPNTTTDCYVGFATSTPSSTSYFEDCFYINSSSRLYAKRYSTNVYNESNTVSSSDYLSIEVYDQEVRFYKNATLLKRVFTPHGYLSSGLYFYAWFKNTGNYISEVEITSISELPGTYYIESVTASNNSLLLATSVVPTYWYLETSSSVSLVTNSNAQLGVMHYLLIANTSSSDINITLPSSCMAPSLNVVIPGNKYIEFSYIYSVETYAIITFSQPLSHFNT